MKNDICAIGNALVDTVFKVPQELIEELGLEIDQMTLSSSEEQAPIINLVNLLLDQAIMDRASDIHIEPGETETLVRIRIDGKLKETKRLSKKLHPSIVSRIKVMGLMDIAESRIPQDGQTQYKLKEKVYECRISVLPGVYGENIVMRILDKSKLDFDISNLGLVKKRC